MKRNFIFSLIAGVVATSAVATSLPTQWKTESAVRPGFYKAKAVYAVFKGDSPTVKSANAELEKEAKRAVRSFKKEGATMERPRAEWFFEMQNVISVAQPDLISTYTRTFWYTGGAHPNRDYTTQNFAVVKGTLKRFGLSDLLAPGVRPAQIDDLIIGRLRDMKASEALANNIPYFSPPQRDRFYVSPGGMTWIFPPYEVGPYVEGEFFVKLTWDELAPLIDNSPIRAALQK